ncbi:MAG: glycerate kinase [Nitrospirae bacterium]|nr:glycerate kinase [Nitrospirota bacterium]
MTDCLIDIYNAAVGACSAYNCVLNHIDHVRRVYSDGGFRRLYVVGFGKGAYGMALAASDRLDDIITGGVAVTKYGHSEACTVGKIKIVEAGHPVPDENGVRGTAEIIELVKDAAADTLILCLISGGGSALFVSPAVGVSLAEKQAITEALLKSGCDINELNAVRKQLSKVKGGGFAALAYPAKILSLIISDVPGNRLDVIASGPTTANTTGASEAIEVLNKYGLMSKLPPNVIEAINKGAARRPVNPGNENIIIADNRQALNAALARARELGLDAAIITDNLAGDVKAAAKWLSKEAAPNKKLLISGGETTVAVTGTGRGGRNMELALRFAVESEGQPGLTLLSAGTDGTDGPTDAAGAIVDGATTTRGRAAGLDAREYLANNDSYTYFERAGGLFKPGPTGTNVMDIQLLLCDGAI